MNNEKEILLDFIRWYYDNESREALSLYNDTERAVDGFLKSRKIAATNKAPIVRGNKDEEKFCKCTEEPMWLVGGKCVSCDLPQKK